MTQRPKRGYNPAWLADLCAQASCRHRRDAHESWSRYCEVEGCTCAAFVSPNLVGWRTNLDEGRRARRQTHRPRPTPIAPIRTEVSEVEDPAYEAAHAELRRSETSSPSLHLSPRGVNPRCPYCHSSDFNEDPAVRCPSCKAWQHVECTREHKRCSACNERWILND